MGGLFKFSTVAAIAVFIALGCDGKKKPPPPTLKPAPAPVKADPVPEEADLQTRCFDGDPAACDELGH